MIKYQFFCDHCGFKKFSNGSDINDLTEVKKSPIPRGAPTLNPEAKAQTAVGWGQPSVVKTGQIVQPPIQQRKRFKCPQCGYVIKPRRLKENEQTNQPNGREAGPPGSPLS